MTREELLMDEWVKENFGDACYPNYLEPNFELGVEYGERKIIEKACKCYCDDICDKGRCGMCFHKHDGERQVKNSFQYNECNELKLMRKVMEE